VLKNIDVSTLISSSDMSQLSEKLHAISAALKMH
jgi:hypothetical protein